MPRFEYVTQKRKGDSYVRAVIEGQSLADVSIRLNNLNQPIVLITDPSRKTTAEKKERVSLRTKLTFLENLEAAVYLGMDFRTALSICLTTTPTRDRAGKRMAHIIERLRDRVSKGMSFANAISSYPEVFDEVAIGLISAGEEGGTLTEALTNVRKIWARNEDLRHRLLMMLIYPMIVFAAAIGVVWLLMTRVVPQFIGVPGRNACQSAASDGLFAQSFPILQPLPSGSARADYGCCSALLAHPGLCEKAPPVPPPSSPFTGYRRAHASPSPG